MADREPSLLQKIFALKDNIKVEPDFETLELLHMELADLEWLVTCADGEKPSTIWEEYKTDNDLNFDKKVA